MCHGLITLIPDGGHTVPISYVGAKLEWKKAQKKATKNKTSEMINITTPYLKPNCTIFVWCPSYVASLITSRHQHDTR
jgi:hypothetical protein